MQGTAGEAADTPDLTFSEKTVAVIRQRPAREQHWTSTDLVYFPAKTLTTLPMLTKIRTTQPPDYLALAV